MSPLVAIATLSHAGDTVDVQVSGPRPLADAATILSRETGWIVQYEDVAILSPTDAKDWGPETAALRGVPVPTELLGPRGGSLSVVIDVAGGPDAALATLLAAHHLAGNPGRFEVRRDGQRYSLVPASATSAAGTLVAAEVLLDTRVTLAPAEQTVDSAISEVLAAVSRATGQTLFTGHASHRDSTARTVSASDERARTVLARILDEAGSTQAWHLYSSPMHPTVHCLNLVETAGAPVPEAVLPTP